MIRRWILKQLGILGRVNRAELEINLKISGLDISADMKDEITDIVFEALKHIRNC